MNKISENHLDTIVHAVSQKLNTMGINLDSDLMSDLNQHLDDFFTGECEIAVSDKLTYSMLSVGQKELWKKLAKEEKTRVETFYKNNKGILPTADPIGVTDLPQNPTNLSFSLLDESIKKAKDVTGFMDNTGNVGLSIYFKGYGDRSSKEQGAPIYIEKHDGKLRALIYSDINTIDPTHIISLEKANLENREEDIQYEKEIK